MIRIFVGSEPDQRIAAAVLKSSILRRTSDPVEFCESWTHETGWHRALIGYPRLGGTLFSFWRWLVPLLCEYRGRAIYLDADQVVLTDIRALWDSLPAGKDLAAVVGAEGNFGGKKPDPGAIETSVMVLDCSRCAWNPPELHRLVTEEKMLRWCAKQLGGKLERSPKSDYAALMQAAWIPLSRIERLWPGWNHFNELRATTKLLHWSCVRSQPYRNPDHETARVFHEELWRTVEAGHLATETIEEEIRSGHLSPEYKRCIL